MLSNLKKKFNNALQEASIITDNLQQQYRQRFTTPEVGNMFYLLAGLLQSDSVLCISCSRIMQNMYRKVQIAQFLCVFINNISLCYSLCFRTSAVVAVLCPHLL